MQQIMQIGEKLVVADEDVKDLSEASKEITSVAEKYKTDVLAVISKTSGKQIVAQHREKNNTKFIEDLAKIIAVIEAISNDYDVDPIEIADIINTVLEKEE